jgi:hypothetical protein
MKTLYETIVEEQQIDEGLLKNMMSRPVLNRMSAEDLKTGILNMYDYICAGDDMEKFYMDFPKMQKMFWKNLYELYQSKAFGMFEIEPTVSSKYSRIYDDDDDDRRPSNISSRKTAATTIDDIASDDEVVKVTPEIRRMLRDVIDNSKVGGKSKISAADPMFIYVTEDPLYEDEYRMMFTINKAANMFSRKFLEALFKKIDEN